MQTIAEFIDALGGTTIVAGELGLPVTTVSSWKSAGSVPHWRRDGLLGLAKKKSVGAPKELSA